MGMMVNCNKTQLLCVAPTRTADTTCYITTDAGVVKSQKMMKLLGFIFDDNASMGAHVAHVLKKVGMRSWILTHLRKAKIDSQTIVEI